MILAGAFGEVIFRFTKRQPMTIEEIVEALTYTAGHALAQKAAKQFATTKALREVAIRSLDRGIKDGEAGDGSTPQIILPGPNTH